MKAIALRCIEKLQNLRPQSRGRVARLVEVQSFGATTKIAVVEFAGQTLLLSVARDGVRLIASDASR